MASLSLQFHEYKTHGVELLGDLGALLVEHGDLILESLAGLLGHLQRLEDAHLLGVDVELLLFYADELLAKTVLLLLHALLLTIHGVLLRLHLQRGEEELFSGDKGFMNRHYWLFQLFYFLLKNYPSLRIFGFVF